MLVTRQVIDLTPTHVAGPSVETDGASVCHCASATDSYSEVSWLYLQINGDSLRESGFHAYLHSKMRVLI